jgi:hypothetical protein
MIEKFKELTQSYTEDHRDSQRNKLLTSVALCGSLWFSVLQKRNRSELHIYDTYLQRVATISNFMYEDYPVRKVN